MDKEYFKCKICKGMFQNDKLAPCEENICPACCEQCFESGNCACCESNFYR